MKTFEEKWTAWVDGQLSGRELSEFEASLPDKAAAEGERAGALKLGELLKRELSARTLRNEEFFSHQLRESIARLHETPGIDMVDNSSPVVDRRCVARSVFGFYRSCHAREKSG